MKNIFKAKWRIGEDTKDFPIRTKIVRVIDDEPNEPYELEVCHVLPSARKKEHIKLITSAPELLRACNFALQEIKKGQVDELTIKILEDAISNAIGEKCDVCGSTNVIEAPHMGKNCNDCHPL